MMFRLFVFLTIFLPGLASADAFPGYDNPYVNDYADVLDEATEAKLHDTVKALRDDTGVELTVLTLPTRETYAPGSTLEDFATGLFNHWGIGNSDRNDGILILVLTEDRDMRIELGAGYDHDYDLAARFIINRDMIPHFKEGDFATGLTEGTARVIDWIALPFTEGRKPPEKARLEVSPEPQPDTSDGADTGITILFMTLVAGGVGLSLFGGRIRNRLRRCPQCGQRGVDKTVRVLTPATRKTVGQGEKTLRCRHCGYERISSYEISRKTTSSTSSGFGGGRSSGGGASGSW